MMLQIVFFVVVVISGPPGYLLKVCNCSHFCGLMSILDNKTVCFCNITLFSPIVVLLFFFQNIWFSTQIHAGGLCGFSVVHFLQKPSFYLSATLVFFKGLLCPGPATLKKPSVFKHFTCSKHDKSFLPKVDLHHSHVICALAPLGGSLSITNHHFYCRNLMFCSATLHVTSIN